MSDDQIHTTRIEPTHRVSFLLLESFALRGVLQGIERWGNRPCLCALLGLRVELADLGISHCDVVVSTRPRVLR
jgi:hypothetical protein